MLDKRRRSWPSVSCFWGNGGVESEVGVFSGRASACDLWHLEFLVTIAGRWHPAWLGLKLSTALTETVCALPYFNHSIATRLSPAAICHMFWSRSRSSGNRDIEMPWQKQSASKSDKAVYHLGGQSTHLFNPLTAKLFNLNFNPLEVVSRWRDPQLQVSENYSDLTKWRSTVFKYCWLMSHFIFNMFKRWYLMC